MAQRINSNSFLQNGSNREAYNVGELSVDFTVNNTTYGAINGKHNLADNVLSKLDQLYTIASNKAELRNIISLSYVANAVQTSANLAQFSVDNECIIPDVNGQDNPSGVCFSEIDGVETGLAQKSAEIELSKRDGSKVTTPTGEIVYIEATYVNAGANYQSQALYSPVFKNRQTGIVTSYALPEDDYTAFNISVVKHEFVDVNVKGIEIVGSGGSSVFSEPKNLPQASETVVGGGNASTPDANALLCVLSFELVKGSVDDISSIHYESIENIQENTASRMIKDLIYVGSDRKSLYLKANNEIPSQEHRLVIAYNKAA
jgi:hypothetical protein